MKHTFLCVVLFLLSSCFFAACGDKKTQGEAADGDSLAQKTAVNAPYEEPELKNTFTAKLAGKNCEITVVRKADKSLPVVTDELGKQFCDNRVNVTILADGELFFEKSYTKEAFADFLSDAEKQGTVLLGMAFDSEKSDASALRLGAQIGQVGIEEGPAFSVEIPLNGSASSIVRDQEQDTTGNAAYEE